MAWKVRIRLVIKQIGGIIVIIIIMAVKYGEIEQIQRNRIICNVRTKLIIKLHNMSQSNAYRMLTC